jgi:DNA-binding MarR family transcriptional regulator
MESKEDIIKKTISELLRISKLYSRIEEMPIPVEKDLEVTTREAHTIQAVGDNEPISVTQLASYLGITKSAASQMGSKLTKRGFFKKKQAAHSNKEFELSLLPLGWKAYKAHEQFHGKDLNDLIERLNVFSLSQIATLSVLLESLGSVMKQRIIDRGDR